MIKSKSFKYLSQLFSYLPKKRREEFIYLLPIALVTGISELIVILFLTRLLNFLIGKPNPSLNLISDLFDFEPKIKIIILIFGFIFSNWIASILKIILKTKIFKMKANISRDLSEIALKNLLTQDYEFFLGNNQTDLSASVLLIISRVTDSVVLPLIQSISAALMILLISITILIVAKSIAFLLILGLLAGYMIISLFITPKIRIANRKRGRLEIKANYILSESIRSFIDVRLSNSQEYFLNKYKITGRKLIQVTAIGETLPEIPRALVEPFGITLIFLVGMFPIFFDNNAQIADLIPFLATIAAASLKLTPPLQDSFKAYNSIRGSLPDLERALEILKKRRNNYSELKNKSLSSNRGDFRFPKKQISFNQVSYRYPNSKKYMIKNLSFDINIGSKIAFVGCTGSGKTTTVNLLLQLLIPQKGFLYLDEEKLTVENIKSWQSNCAYVPQSFYLNNASILENVAFGKDRDDIDVEKVKRAIASAKLSELVSNLPNGIETNIGENGISLSGGQRQRLAIARAFYREAKVLILDEATSALDNKTESKVMESIDIQNNNCTLIIIAHRLSTVINADKIFEFNNGEIIHSGKFEELCEISKNFKDLNFLDKKILKS